MAQARRRTASRARQQPAPRSAAASSALTAFGFCVGIVAQTLGYPGVAVAWLFATVAAFAAQPPELTGKKDPRTNSPTPGHPGEEKALRKFRFWSDLKWSLVLPFQAVAPGLPPYAAWVYGLVAAAAAWGLPQEYMVGRHANAALALVLVTAFAESRRKTVVPGDTSPGVRLNPVGAARAAREAGWLVTTFVVLTTVPTGLLLGFIADAFAPALPVPADLADTIESVLPQWLGFLGAAVAGAAANAWWVVGFALGAGAVGAPWWVSYSLTHWRTVVEAREEWAPRWQGQKIDPAPFLEDREEVGQAVVDTFRAPPALGAMKFWPMAGALTPAIGAGKRVAVLSVPDIDSAGRPQPGTQHPLLFQVVVYPADGAPDITNPATPQEEVDLFLSFAMAQACDAAALPRMLLEAATPIGVVDDEALARAARRPSPLDYVRGFVDRTRTAASKVSSGTSVILGPLFRAVAFLAGLLVKALRAGGLAVAAASSAVRRRLGALLTSSAKAAEREAAAQEELLADLFPSDDESEAPGQGAVPAPRRDRLLGVASRRSRGAAESGDVSVHDAEEGVPFNGDVPIDLDHELPDDENAEPSVPVGSTQAYRVTWLSPGGTNYLAMRMRLKYAVAAELGAEVLVDHEQGASFVGALLDGDTSLAPDAGVTYQSLRELQTEDDWVGRWGEILKSDVNPPLIQHAVYAEAKLADGTVVYQQPFIARRGQDVQAEYFHQEKKVASALDAVPFVAITGWHRNDGGGRQGERHAMAFCVYWAHSPVPATPDTLAPVPGSEAPRWVLAGRVNDAFRAAKMPKPEVAAVRCLTEPRSRGHLWQLRVRLFDVTFAQVRGQAEALRQALGAAWLRVAEAPDGCTIVVGADPKRVRLANPTQHAPYLVSLDWEQAFIDSKVTGVGGLTPKLAGVGNLPKNQQVQVIDFDLPAGLSYPEVREATNKLATATKNAFVEVRRHPDGRADRIQIYACEVNPMPEAAAFNWEEAEPTSHRIPFATGLTGEAVTYDNRIDPHLLVSGTSGGGKSVALQAFVYGSVARDWDLYVIDPSKGGVDFQFAEEWSFAFGRTVWEAKGIIEAIYKEVVRRKAINAAHNCGNYRDLPDEVRYPHVLVVMDEFTSMMMPEPVPKALTDDPGVLAEIAKAQALNAARAYIGTYVGKIVREARSTGFTMLLATQALKADTLSKIPGANDLKDNMSRMIVGRASTGQLQAALKMPFEVPPQPDVLPPGRGLYEGNSRPPEVIQVWFEGSQEAFRAGLAARRAPIDPALKLDLSAFVEPEIEVDGGILGEPPAEILTPSPEAVMPAEPVEEVIDVIDLSLDDLLALDDEESPDEEGASATAADPSSAGTEAEATHLPVETPLPEADTGEEATPLEAHDQPVEPDAEPLTAAPGIAGFAPPALPKAEAPASDRLAGFSPGFTQSTPPEPATAPDPEEDEGVLVSDQIVWDEIDPSDWEPPVSEYGWTEIDALVAFLADFPEVRHVTWTADRLGHDSPLGVSFRDVVVDLLAERGVTYTGATTTASDGDPLPPAQHEATDAPAFFGAVVAPPAPLPVSPPAPVSGDEFDSVPTLPPHLVPAQDPFA